MFSQTFGIHYQVIPRYNRLGRVTAYDIVGITHYTVTVQQQNLYMAQCFESQENFSLNIDIVCDPSNHEVKLKEYTDHHRASPPSQQQRTTCLTIYIHLYKVT